jgi:hypothetical protein
MAPFFMSEPITQALAEDELIRRSSADNVVMKPNPAISNQAF